MTTETITLDTQTDVIDLLAGLMFADADETELIKHGGGRATSDGMVLDIVDAGSKLNFSEMRPRRAYTFDMLDDGRLFSFDPQALLYHPAETIGRESEFVLLKDNCLLWTGFRRLARPPKRTWVGSTKAALYEVHYRQVFQDGMSSYNKRIAAVDRNGYPVPCVIEGTAGIKASREGENLVMAASIIEDCHRSGAIRCELTDHNTIIAPIPLGAQKALFALRDGPLTGRGRRRAILHHVMRHRRESSAGTEHEVREHFRGVTSFVVDGLRVTLAANDADKR